jgi:hypothetical protein
VVIVWNEILSVLLDSELAERRESRAQRSGVLFTLDPGARWPEQAGHGDLVNAKMLKK